MEVWKKVLELCDIDRSNGGLMTKFTWLKQEEVCGKGLRFSSIKIGLGRQCLLRLESGK